MPSIEIRKEIANGITHGIGVVLALIGIPFIIYYASLHEQTSTILAATAYSFGLLMVYLSSTLYHSIQQPKVKRALRIWDHISIFFLIAGTYTPFIVLFINTGMGWGTLIGMWVLVVLGTIYKLFYTGKHEWFGVAIYLLMGWSAVLLGKSLFTDVPRPVFYWILAGGLSYSFGVIFYKWKGLTYHHAIWHLFVMGGSAAHFIAVLIGLKYFV